MIVEGGCPTYIVIPGLQQALSHALRIFIKKTNQSHDMYNKGLEHCSNDKAHGPSGTMRQHDLSSFRLCSALVRGRACECYKIGSRGFNLKWTINKQKRQRSFCLAYLAYKHICIDVMNRYEVYMFTFLLFQSLIANTFRGFWCGKAT